MRKAWNFYLFLLNDFQGLRCLPLGTALMHLSQPKQTWGWNNYLISVMSFTDFLGRFFVRLFYSLQATYQHYRQRSLEVIWRQDLCKTQFNAFASTFMSALMSKQMLKASTSKITFLPDFFDVFFVFWTVGVERRQTMIPKLSLGRCGPQASI